MLGVAARRLNILRESVINGVSRFAFVAALPVMLFASAARVDFYALEDINYLLAGIFATLITALLAWYYGRWRQFPRARLGIFVQAAFRSNLAIVGIALCVSAYGDIGLALAALPIAILTALYNVLAVLVLNSTLGSSHSPATFVLGILRNPLIIGIAAGIAVSLLEWPVPGAINVLADGVATYYLPLALLCIGGAMHLDTLRTAAALTWEATAWRLCLAPVVGVVLALLMGVRGEPLGVLFLLLSSPVAAASFVMVVAARGDGQLAANMVILTTLCSVITVTAGFFVLSLMGLVGVTT
jgi:predicted permease